MMPTEPGKNAIGMNTAINTSVMPMIAPVICYIAFSVASCGASPCEEADGPQEGADEKAPGREEKEEAGKEDAWNRLDRRRRQPAIALIAATLNPYSAAIDTKKKLLARTQREEFSFLKAFPGKGLPGVGG